MRTTFLPYCLPLIGEEEIAEVVDSIRGGWVTTGPKVKRFEDDFARYVDAKHAIAVNSCTAGLHLSLKALNIGPGDEVIVPTMTFCATANVVAHLGATPVLVDVDENFQISPEATARAITRRTRAIMPVHYAGQPCDLDEIVDLASRRGIEVVEDAAHAAGAEYHGRKIGAHSRAVVFSFYATKNMTTGEGGMITTNDDQIASRIRLLSLHGMSRDAWQRYSETGSWYYEVTEPGYKYNMTDIQGALGIHQLRRLDDFIERRRQIAAAYAEAFRDMPELLLPHERPGRRHIYHLYPVRLVQPHDGFRRADFIEKLKRANIGSSVHFIPVHRHPYYQQTYGYNSANFPVAERLYEGLFSLPLYPKMTDGDVRDVIDSVRAIVMEGRAARPPAGPQWQARRQSSGFRVESEVR